MHIFLLNILQQGSSHCEKENEASDRALAPIDSETPRSGSSQWRFKDGRSPGLRFIAANPDLPGIRYSRISSGLSDRQLVAHSCGGSHGIGKTRLTVFPIILIQLAPAKEPSPRSIQSKPKPVNTGRINLTWMIHSGFQSRGYF